MLVSVNNDSLPYESKSYHILYNQFRCIGKYWIIGLWINILSHHIFAVSVVLSYIESLSWESELNCIIWYCIVPCQNHQYCPISNRCFMNQNQTLLYFIGSDWGVSSNIASLSYDSKSDRIKWYWIWSDPVVSSNIEILLPYECKSNRII